jgi:hypothetical protein
MDNNELPYKEIFEMITFDMLDHFGSHKIDPCNVLIGRSPSHSVIETLEPFDSSNVRNTINEENVPNFYDSLQRWSTIGTNWRRVEKEMTIILEKMKGNLKYQTGDLVIIKTKTLSDDSRFVFNILFEYYKLKISYKI